MCDPGPGTQGLQSQRQGHSERPGPGCAQPHGRAAHQHRAHALVHLAGAGLSRATCTRPPPRIQDGALALGLAATLASSLGVRGQVPVRARRALARASSGGLNQSLNFSTSPRGGGWVWGVHVSSPMAEVPGRGQQTHTPTPRGAARAAFPLILGTHTPAAHGRDVHLLGRGQVRQASRSQPRTHTPQLPGLK